MTGTTVAVVFRLWEDRDLWITRRIIGLMLLPAVMALQAILLPFFASRRAGVSLNWKFAIILFAPAVIYDVVMTWVAFGIVKSRKHKLEQRSNLPMTNDEKDKEHEPQGPPDSVPAGPPIEPADGEEPSPPPAPPGDPQGPGR